MKKVNYRRLAVILGLFTTAFLEAVLINLPITLFFLIILAFYWEEKVFSWALLVGLWYDLIVWHHLGSWSIIFLLVSLLVIVVKHHFIGYDRNKLSLPDSL